MSSVNVELEVEREEDVLENGANEGDQNEIAPGQSEHSTEDEVRFKAKRKQLRGKITRAMNRLSYYIAGEERNQRRIQRILTEIKEDYSQVCNVHSELYNFVNEYQAARLDQWENDLAREVYDIEDKVEDYIASLTLEDHDTHTTQVSQRRMVTRATTLRQTEQTGRSESELSAQEQHSTVEPRGGNSSVSETNSSSHSYNLDFPGPSMSVQSEDRAPFGQSFDSWIDNLVEFRETVLPSYSREMSVSEALYKLEASKDIPTITLGKFSGNPLSYVDFIERFKIHIHNKVHLSDDMRMVQLRMHLSGEAERALSGLGSSGINYATALKTLKDQFGQSSCIARACLKGLTGGAKFSVRDRQGLRDFSIDIINCISIPQRIGYQADANSSENLRQIIRRLPDTLIGKWKSVAMEIRERGQVPNIQQVSEFVRKRVRAEIDPDFGDICGGNKPDFKDYKERKKGVHSAQPRSRGLKCFVCEEEHKVTECPTFKDSTIEERVKHVQNNRLCFSCLTKGHGSRECRSRKQCLKNGCTRFHHVLLHVDPPAASGIASVLDKDGILPVLRVNFRSPSGKMREGNVLIDSGAGTTVIRRDFAKALGLQGKRERFDVSVVGGETLEQPQSRRVKFWISALDRTEEHLIEAHEMDKTILSVPALNREVLKSYSHLSNIEFPHRAGPVDLILGVQYSHLHVDEEMRQCLPFEPVGKKSTLGWYVIGADSTKRASAVCSMGYLQKVDLEKFYECETLGVRAPDCNCPAKAISHDDRKVMKLFENSCKRVGDRFEIGLPWKTDSSQLPESYQLAEKRLFSLERRLLKDKQKTTMYSHAIQEYITNGWAQPMTDEEVLSKEPVFYLPHHGVYRPEKVSTPLRIVFDPACQIRGVSLNSFLYKGPCLIGNLLGVLLRFREQQVGFTGDISKMCLQICLPESDTQVHRFLWRDLDTSKVPTVYRLLRVTFGDKPSPDMASFVMLRMAEEAKADFPSASEILERDRYVDDLIHSCASTEEAVNKMNALDKVLSTGSFNIKKWYCSGNLPEKISGCQHNATSVDDSQDESADTVKLDGEETVKALGVAWNSKNDTIKFVVKKVEIGKLTKRIILSRVSGIYDPLGLGSPVTIKARIALQDIWRSKMFDWDDQLPPEVSQRWVDLFQDLQDLEKVELRRSLKPPNVSGPSELHVFADASLLAYGAVAFLSWRTPSGPEVRLVSAKARVAPLRQTTIPRLELMGALIASRLAKTIVEEFKEKPADVTLWTDSQIVLHWLQSESISLKAFVGVRVAEIQSTWEPCQWKYVPTNLNPADDLSRGL